MPAALALHPSQWRSESLEKPSESHQCHSLVAETALCFRARRAQRQKYPGATWGTEATISWSCTVLGDLFSPLSSLAPREVEDP